MAAWEATPQDTTVSRDEAKDLIVQKARAEGFTGSFKVFYKGNMVSDPSNLPERVDMDDIEVSAVLDQA